MPVQQLLQTQLVFVVLQIPSQLAFALYVHPLPHTPLVLDALDLFVDLLATHEKYALEPPRQTDLVVIGLCL